MTEKEQIQEHIDAVRYSKPMSNYPEAKKRHESMVNYVVRLLSSSKTSMEDWKNGFIVGLLGGIAVGLCLFFSIYIYVTAVL